MKFQKVRKKPVEVEAFQITENFLDNNAGDVKIGDRKMFVYINSVEIETLEGVMTGNLNDWIIKGINGEIYPCKPNIFEKTYDIL